MLPTPALDIVAQYLDSPGMGCYVRLSQVNQAPRQYFMSGWAWNRYDIHQVGGTSTNSVYSYNQYTIGGVAGHFMCFLETLDPEHRAWHLRLKLEGAIGEFEWGDLYDHLHRSCTLNERYPYRLDRYFEYSTRQLTLVPQSVWEFHLQFSYYTKWNLRFWDYKHLLNSGPIFMAFIARTIFPLGFEDIVGRYGYQDDREINMELVKRGLFELCSTQFKNDKQFLLEMVRHSMFKFGRFELFSSRHLPMKF